MILAFDTGYFEHKAKTVCIAFEEWTSTVCTKVYAEVSKNIEEYVPGAFYRRELPGILSLWPRVEEKEVEAIVIDGFVYLDDEGRLGLGGHLYRQLGGRVPVIGVAKTNFAALEKNKRLVFRGGSKRPLYITAVGIDLERAAHNIERMAGAFRIPALLKELDRLTKQH